jgi:hypothetical protein
VRFHFLYQLTALDFERRNGKRYVTALTFRTDSDDETLDHLRTSALDEFGCWPDHRGGITGLYNSGVKQLKVSEDFEFAILAIGVDDLRDACFAAAPNKVALSSMLGAHWPAMFDNVRTVATKCAQVWLAKDLEGLGWYRGSRLVTALGFSFDTWADMTHVLATESWRRHVQGGGAANARSVAYFCAPLRDSKIQSARKMARKAVDRFTELTRGGVSGMARVGPDLASDFARKAMETATSETPWVELRDSFQQVLAKFANALTIAPPETVDQAKAIVADFLVKSAMDISVARDLAGLLKMEMRQLWPAYESDPKFDQADLIVASHVQAKFRGSERYTLSEPGLVVHRISPLDRSVENMTIAGDWTACGLDVGCVEAAVMAGMLASHAISGKLDLKQIIGYDHP